MTTTSFSPGTAIRLAGKQLIVHDASPKTRILFDVETRELRTEKLNTLRKAYERGELTFEDLFTQPRSNHRPADTPEEIRSIADYTPAQQVSAKRKLHYLTGICPSGFMNRPRSELRRALHELHETIPSDLKTERGPSVASFYAWRKAWIASGYTTKSLVDRHDLSGRKPQDTPKELQPIINRLIDGFFATNLRPTLKELFDQTEAEVNRHNLIRAPLDQLPRPTQWHIKRELEKVDRYELLKRRYGPARARTATRTFGKSEPTIRLGERVEIDHTPLDVLCIDENMVCGRPFLTVLIDVASRMIVGAWISFREPNVDTVLRALKHAILPKDGLLKELGIKGSWPAQGIFSCLVMDNGKELISTAIDCAAHDLGFSVVRCPPRQPFYKGTVERVQKTINYGFMHIQPGTTFDKYFKREGYDSVANAVIQLSVLLPLIYRWIVEVYHLEYHRGIQACPLDKWNELAKTFQPPLPRNVQVLDAFLTQGTTRHLSSKGIEINSQFYISDELRDIRHRLGDQALKIRPNHDDLGHIHVLHPETNHYFKANCTDPAYADGLTLEQHKWLTKRAKDAYRNKPHREALLAAKLEMREEVEALQKNHAELRDQAKQAEQPTKRLPKRLKKAKPRSGLDKQAFADTAAQAKNPKTPRAFTPKKLSFDGVESFPHGQQPLL